MFQIFLAVFTAGLVAGSTTQTNFTVSESAPVGHIIGYVNGSPAIGMQPNFFVVYPQPDTEKILAVDERTGEITVIAPIDYETNRSFELLAVRVDGRGEVAVTIDVVDENDHAPTFPKDYIKLEISEFARLNAEFPLPLAEDADGPPLDVQNYKLAEGNVNNVFRLVTRRVDSRLYADLVVNGALDREYREKYELIVEAVDGGEPPRSGRLRVEVRILDANDNAPVFSSARYSASVPANASLLTPVLTVEAKDADVGDNAVSRADVAPPFSLDSMTGLLRVAGPLVPGSNHEMVVVAADGGSPSLESTVFISVNVMTSEVSVPLIDVLWLTDTTQPLIPENVTLGSVAARISLSNQDSKSVFTMSGCDRLCMQQSDSSAVYLLLVCGPFDRETRASYQMQFVLKTENDIVLDHPVHLTVMDVNDNAPRWSSSSMRITLNGSSNDGDQEWNLAAEDPDEGDNGRLSYSILDSNAATIDVDTGVVQLSDDVDCSSTGSELSFRVRAEDHGRPSLVGELSVIADLVSSSTRPPLFEHPFYEVEVKEDADVGSCILKVKASKSDCGGPTLRYSLKGLQTVFTVDDVSGTLCLREALDFEATKRYQLTVLATDSSGNVASSVINVAVKDVNDNAPVFSPSLYNVSLLVGHKPEGPLLRVLARDADAGAFGQVRYRVEDDQEGLVRVEAQSGEVFLEKTPKEGVYHVKITAKDGSGLASSKPALLTLTILPASAVAPQFLQDSFEIATSEEILPGISIGEVPAVASSTVRYSIYDGDPEHLFLVNPETGRITVARYLDAEKHSTILLNIKVS